MKRLVGIVTSTKTAQTATVEVVQLRSHPVYKKRMKIKRKFLADNRLRVKEGDKVKIQECRPLSKNKCWRVVEKLS